MTAEQMRAGQFRVILYSSLSIVFWTALNERIVALFILRLDPTVTNSILALFFALAPVMSVLTAMMSPLVDTVGKKRIMIPFYWASSVFMVLLFAVRWTTGLWGARGAVWATASVLLGYSAVRSAGISGWFPLIDDSVPDESRGRFFGRLRTSWQTVFLVCTALAGWFLGTRSELWRFQTLFGIAVLVNVVGTFVIMSIPEAPVAPKRFHKAFLQRLAVPFRNRVFVNFLIFGALYHFALGVVGPLGLLCMKSTLHAGDNFVVWMETLAALGAVLTLRLWGRFVDRFGSRAVFALLLPPAALANLIWLLVRPDAGSWRTLLCVYFLLQGALNAGVGVGVTDMMLGSSGTWYRSAYINVAFVANTLSAGLAPLVGSSIAALVADRTVGLGPFTFDAARVVFVLRCALAFAPLAILGGLSRRHGGHVSEAIQQLGLYVSGWLPFFRVGTGREDDEQED